MKKSLLKTALAALALAFLFAACKNQSTPESNSGKTSKPDPAREIPLTLEAIENTTITLSNADLVENLKYSIDGGELKDVSSSTPVEIPLSGDSCISFYGEGTSNYLDDHGYYFYFNINCSADCYVYGNVMSLLSSDFKDKTEITKDYAFCRLFYNNTHIKNKAKKELLLPATSLADNCYRGMFQGGTSLETAPALPAKSLAKSCYYGMFSGCTSLTATPALPAKSLAYNCYELMFNGCTSLTKAPELPATSLANGCYAGMFQKCTSLIAAPDLPATSLEIYCYYSMFSLCNKLNYVKCLATDISATGCLESWLYGVASTGTFEKAATATWAVAGTNGIPSGWTVTDAADN